MFTPPVILGMKMGMIIKNCDSTLGVYHQMYVTRKLKPKSSPKNHNLATDTHAMTSEGSPEYHFLFFLALQPLFLFNTNTHNSIFFSLFGSSYWNTTENFHITKSYRNIRNCTMYSIWICIVFICYLDRLNIVNIVCHKVCNTRTYELNLFLCVTVVS